MDFNFTTSDTEKKRYGILVETLTKYRYLFEGKRVLDFGASWGTSAIALSELGAKEVIGVELDADRVREGNALISSKGLSDKVTLIHSSDTSKLQFNDQEFSFIIANAVFEHIPQPRDVYFKELWRLLTPNGCLMINETPNSFFPKEMHTTNLWFNHWLPKSLAYKRAIKNNRFDPSRSDWDSSGWRGLNYFEMVRSLSNYKLIPESQKLRHRIFTSLGLPASLIDPYPVWILQKIN